MKRASKGFSLIEILVAFVILALALGVLMRVFSGALGNAGAAERYSQAVVLAESRLAEAGREYPLVEGDHEGTTDTGYHWTVSIHPVALDADEPETLGKKLVLYDVGVDVAWRQESDKTRRVRLSSLRLGVME
jgi:general secretion pathway protein I